jgi:hypothetical protein
LKDKDPVCNDIFFDKNLLMSAGFFSSSEIISRFGFVFPGKSEDYKSRLHLGHWLAIAIEKVVTK